MVRGEAHFYHQSFLLERAELAHLFLFSGLLASVLYIKQGNLVFSFSLFYSAGLFHESLGIGIMYLYIIQQQKEPFLLFTVPSAAG
jgi:hypothetical protein